MIPLVELRILFNLFELVGDCLGEGETFLFEVVRLAIEALLFNWREGEGDDCFRAFSFYPNVSSVFNSDYYFCCYSDASSVTYVYF